MVAETHDKKQCRWLATADGTLVASPWRSQYATLRHLWTERKVRQLEKTGWQKLRRLLTCFSWRGTMAK
eukprot:Skav215182  [mRNA]  locus=scaffold3330:34909:37360:- [translate_table: standard]